MSHTQQPLALVLDIGTSSVRCAVYRSNAVVLPGTAARRPVAFEEDGTANIELLADRTEEAIDECLTYYRETAAGIGPLAVVGWTAFAMSWLGVNGAGAPVTPVYTYADATSGPYADQLRADLAEAGRLAELHQQTGTPIHVAYAPAQLLRLAAEEPERLAKVARFQTASAHLLARWSGQPFAPVSTSEAGWTGLLDRSHLDWNDDLLALLPIERGQLPPILDYTNSSIGLSSAYRRRWPELSDARFCLAVGDGAAANIGSGGVDASRLALTIGTSGALRVVLPQAPDEAVPIVPDGLWCYPVDNRRWLVGGALTDGGSLFNWLLETLRYANPTTLLADAASLEADSHGLTILPFLRSERSPGWANDAKMTISGITANTTPAHILRAVLEAVALRFRLINERLAPHLPADSPILAGGGGLQENPLWRQILADALGRPVHLTNTDEVTSRGAAILAFKTLAQVDPIPLPDVVETATPQTEAREAYAQAAARQAWLYELILGDR
ncbi:MAG: gluconokinase [Caldilineaceae bacterium]|nr:gluconokinase [Caldilineaceae bacterium]